MYKHTYNYTSAYNFICAFVCIHCAIKYVMIIVGRNNKNAIHNVGYGVAFFSTF